MEEEQRCLLVIKGISKGIATNSESLSDVITDRGLEKAVLKKIQSWTLLPGLDLQVVYVRYLCGHQGGHAFKESDL